MGDVLRKNSTGTPEIDEHHSFIDIFYDVQK
jgi:hypothetical protein